MKNLFLSFLIAVSSAAGLVGLSHALEMDSYTGRIFPLIPLLYAITHQILERLRSGKTKQFKTYKITEDIKEGFISIFQQITISRMLTAVAISFCIKIVFETYLSLLFIHFNNTSFTNTYGSFSMGTISRFLRGDHPWLMGNEGFYLLVLLALFTSLGTGIWIGYTTKSGAGAVLEGVLAGTVVTLFTALTNMLILYQQIEEMANQMATSMGYGIRIGFIAVLSMQVLLYGFWSGVAKKMKQERTARRAAKKLSKSQNSKNR
ncbi:MAG: hypothetical protein A2056_05540 [Deltaproteobacteria bacterium GWA2_42_85]|nr:MAG: hypothetical protein A2056_05540 [Deltaproteobacteria bacterium GWA2_42_85]OGP31752.1 MAG: hypothetical protein A2067_04240 [Deltaproteobacteria bacterium GWB2_42_7]OGP38842.1 MAG: hypothetical protein A2090_00470 [Deltaproteobacteria bacterium GWD2_42_10]OGP47035.1 MAG: hypothetical protein A2022_07175 [Deltaproteobacteria bacterium GWF2_42_12]OGQ36715.1 MAG: hypothetical protein A3H47_06220 [Deltaproteobacteria bacterium RIFCSPLOWO2_02_FULL_42_39]OGQ66534.1 MAG: hypothetical protein 